MTRNNCSEMRLVNSNATQFCACCAVIYGDGHDNIFFPANMA
jgi:hypothetical protein